MKYHETVFKNEAVAHLQVKSGGKYIDCTLGDGGHTLEILKLGGNTLSIDQDPGAFERSEFHIAEEIGLVKGNYFLHEGNFKDIDQIASKYAFSNVNGILYDLGTSFHQLDDEERGFSFTSDAPLDMRMSPSLSVTAKDLVNALSERELLAMLSEFGGEHHAKSISRAIVNARKVKQITTCSELAELISKVSFRKPGDKIHPATKTFQALRIAVNDELGNFNTSLDRAASLLIPGGRLVIISFHSLEDKIAKRVRPGLRSLLEKPLTPSQEEVSANTRARSAKLRVYEKQL